MVEAVHKMVAGQQSRRVVQPMKRVAGVCVFGSSCLHSIVVDVRGNFFLIFPIQYRQVGLLFERRLCEALAWTSSSNEMTKALRVQMLERGMW